MIMIRMKLFTQKASIIIMTVLVIMMNMFQKSMIQDKMKLCNMWKFWIFLAGD